MADPWRMFASQRAGEWFYVSLDPRYVKDYGREPVPVLVTELPSDTASDEVDGFGWIATNERVGQEPDGVPQMIWPQLFLLSMCFPYGLKAEAALGRGRIVKLRIEQVESVAGGEER